MSRTLKIAVWTMMSVLVLWLVIILSGENKLAIWSTGMCLIVLTTLKWSGFKGLSTVLFWMAFGFFIYAYLCLMPIGIVRGIHVWLLSALAFGLGLWDNRRLPRTHAPGVNETDVP